MTPAHHRVALGLAASLLLLPFPVLAQGRAALLETCDDEKAPAAQRFVACTAIIEDSASSAGERADALVNRGTANEDRRLHDEAIADFTAAIALNPKDASAFLLRGNAYDAKGDLDRALADYEAAISLDPNDASGWFNRGTVHEAKGDAARATADYRKALAIDPAHEGARDALAELTAKR